MRKKATIHIHGKQRYPEGHEDQQELITEGIFYEKNGAFYIVYIESGNDSREHEKVTTFLSIKEGAVALNRKGAVDLSQEYRKGILNRSVYTTCHGKIWLSVMPHRVDCDLTVHGGRISLEYDLFFDDNLVSHNELLLNIKEELP